MSGLAGIFSTDDRARTQLDAMVQTLIHRPFLQVDRFETNQLGIARVHPGVFRHPMPAVDPSGRYRLFMDGKVYGTEEEALCLQDEWSVTVPLSDPEFCLLSYLTHGTGFAERLNGSFLLVLLDLEAEGLTIINDRYGMLPLNYAVVPEGFVFASEVAALLEYPSVERTLDDAGIADYFAYGRMLGDKTFLRDVSVMPGGSIMNYRDGAVTLERYWDYPYEPDYSLSEDEYADRLADTFRRAVELRVRSPLRYGVALSGGLDSRAIVGALPRPIRASFTAFPHGQEGCEELPIAERVAETAGIGCKVTILSPDLVLEELDECVRMTDGLDPFIMNFVPKLSCGLRDEGIDVIFHGIGPDTFASGIAYGGDVEVLTRLPPEAVDDYLYETWRFFSDEELARLFTPEFYERVRAQPRRSFDEAIADIPEQDPLNRSDHFELRNHFRRLAAMGLVLWRTGTEVATPGTDVPFIDLCLQIPPEYRKGYRIYRKFLKRLTPELAAIPYNKTMVPPRAPLFAWHLGELFQHVSDRARVRVNATAGAEILRVPCRRVTDYPRWFEEDPRWMAVFRGLLLSPDAASGDYLNRATLKDYFDPNRAAKPLNWLKLVYIVSFELYLRSLRRARAGSPP